MPDVEELRTDHLYVAAAPGCWSAYAALIGRLVATPRLRSVHLLAADVYPAQHPGVPGRQSSQSVWVHLVGLCLTLENGLDPIESARAKGRLATEQDSFEWLPPPPSLGPVTVLDALGAGDSAVEAAVRHWAGSVWSAWEQHHPAIRARANRL